MSPRTRQAVIVATDFLLILLAYLLAYYVRFHGAIPHRNFVPFPVLGPLLALLGVLLLTTYETHRDLHREPFDTYASLALAVTMATALGLTLPYVFGAPAFPRSVFLIAAPLQFALLSASRWPWIAAARRAFRERRFIVVGATAEDAATLARLVRGSFGAVHVLALTAAEAADAFAAPAAVTEPDADAVFVGPHASPELRLAAQSWALARGRQFYAVPSLYDILMLRSQSTRVGDLPVIGARPPEIPPDYAWLKRLVDVAGALLLGAATAPVLALAAAAIALTSPGPVLYRQTRVGLHGRPFTIYKLRTMRVDAEAETGPTLATADDPRVTPVGRWLRALRLDELPQVWNVLRGDMSLVGPRPERPEFVRAFEAQLPHYRLRHNVRPGLTGLAQVMAAYSTDAEEKLRYDLTYIMQASPLLDLKILFLTVRAVLLPGRAGAFPAWAREAAGPVVKSVNR
ncbi:MAG: sugar transferase [Firmicutes bacterium]|nr:sugar transferase [Bacillota bacterium]